MPVTITDIHTQQPLVKYYGELHDTPEQRAAKTLTGLDEYKLIIRSLLILDVLGNNDFDPVQAAETIAAGFPEHGVFGFDPLPKPANCIPNVTYLRSLLGSLDIAKVAKAYVAHDLGKCNSFVREFALCDVGEPTAAAHDTYLETYLQRNPELAGVCNHPGISGFVKILDLLGHAPSKIQSSPVPFPSLKSIATTAVFIKEYAEKITVNCIPVPESTRQAMNTLLLNRAKELKIDTSALNNINAAHSYLALSKAQQNQLAFLMWAGGLRIEEVGASLDEFKTAWENPANADTVSAMTMLLMKNLEQADGFCALYNPTGLLHKTDASKGLKAYVGPSDKGGMGASMEEVVRVAFPFILEQIQASSKIGVVGHNEFQVQQLVELVQNTLPDLGGITTKANSYPHVDFGTLEMNHSLAQRLEASRHRFPEAPEVPEILLTNLMEKQGLFKVAPCSSSDVQPTKPDSLTL